MREKETVSISLTLGEIEKPLGRNDNFYLPHLLYLFRRTVPPPGTGICPLAAASADTPQARFVACRQGQRKSLPKVPGKQKTGGSAFGNGDGQHDLAVGFPALGDGGYAAFLHFLQALFLH